MVKRFKSVKELRRISEKYTGMVDRLHMEANGNPGKLDKVALEHARRNYKAELYPEQT